MWRLPHAVVGVFAGISLIAGGGSSDVLEPSSAQAKEEGTILMAAQLPMVYDFTLNDIDGKPVSLSQFRGKVLLLVNTASFCGNTPQYTDLEQMYEQYREKGFEILAFPAKNFGRKSQGRMKKSKHSATRSTACRFHFSARSA
jgi:hypothetical protein